MNAAYGGGLGAPGSVRPRKMHMFTEMEVEEFKKVFDTFDADGGGTISAKEMLSIMRNMGSNMTQQDVQKMIKEVDTNDDQVLDFDEFVMMMANKLNKSVNQPVTQSECLMHLRILCNNEGKIKRSVMDYGLTSMGNPESRLSQAELLELYEWCGIYKPENSPDESGYGRRVSKNLMPDFNPDLSEAEAAVAAGGGATGENVLDIGEDKMDELRKQIGVEHDLETVDFDNSDMLSVQEVEQRFKEASISADAALMTSAFQQVGVPKSFVTNVPRPQLARLVAQLEETFRQPGLLPEMVDLSAFVSSVFTLHIRDSSASAAGNHLRRPSSAGQTLSPGGSHLMGP